MKYEGEKDMDLEKDETRNVDAAINFLLAPDSGEGVRSGGVLKARRRRIVLLAALAAGASSLLVLYALWWRAPSSFPSDALVAVERGMTLGEAGELLRKKSVIRSPFWFKAWVALLGGQGGLKAGMYSLPEPIAVFRVAWRLARGLENLQPVRITVREGLNNAEVALLLSAAFPHFRSERFLKLAASKEGYLFPDTYIFSPSITEEGIIEAMEENFKRRVVPLEERVKAFGWPLREVVILASLIEGEVRTAETRKLVSGILLKRLRLGMPLQVDAVFPYILGKNTFEVTTTDLQVNSPYNTYRYPGLPPGPINNPGLDAITAAITPTPSDYLYYLTDRNGEVYYAATHEGHLVNRAKYLGK
ncbi:MAG: endolytic transglycosylase MltG [Patescibacteria group bacterium]